MVCQFKVGRKGNAQLGIFYMKRQVKGVLHETPSTACSTW